MLIVHGLRKVVEKEKFLKNIGLFWLEEPIFPPEDFKTLSKINNDLKIPIAPEKMLVPIGNLIRC